MADAVSRSRSTHPWTLSRPTSALADPDTRLLPRRTVAGPSSTSGRTATTDRIVLDEHRSDGGRCALGCGRWLCGVAINVRSRSAR